MLLPNWHLDDTWGRNYWDWEDPVQSETTTDYAVNYLLDHKDYFLNWKNDVRNILAVFLNHTGVSAGSGGEVYHGAWAIPESSGCCGRSLWYATMQMASVFARYGVEADSEWAREIARRSQLLATYDPMPDGQSMDLIDGGAWVNLSWFKIAHPMALKHVLVTMAWLPAVLGADRENHIMRSTAVVRRVTYGKGEVRYSTFDAPANTVDVLRLAFVPEAVSAGGKDLARRENLDAPGYTVRTLAGGDAMVSIRHDGVTEVSVTGPDPQQVMEAKRLGLDASWQAAGGVYRTSKEGASLEVRFSGNQVRLVAPVGLQGGYADVYVDDFKQLGAVDFYSPVPLQHQVVYYRNGLAPGAHKLKLVARGQRNPISKGDEVAVEAVQFSDASGSAGFGEGGGPTGVQRMVFGYTGRQDVVDSEGNSWMPGMEFVARTGDITDVVAKTWWTLRQAVFVTGTPNPELYRYGVHWRDFAINATTGPGTYWVRLKFAENEFNAPGQRGIDIVINGKKVVDGFDVLATAGGRSKAVDLVFPGIQPKNGIIEIRLAGRAIQGVVRDAMIQALEIGPGTAGSGAEPKTIGASAHVE
ncbi:MAG: malectin domain-containing carbohydrate-binding protein [Acidobacteria bacterium]|nr:malectin domain-containing carbohydrate-binding protein [Acidobacteriota bacterium]